MFNDLFDSISRLFYWQWRGSRERLPPRILGGSGRGFEYRFARRWSCIGEAGALFGSVGRGGYQRVRAVSRRSRRDRRVIDGTIECK